jgi:hypothetical protein
VGVLGGGFPFFELVAFMIHFSEEQIGGNLGCAAEAKVLAKVLWLPCAALGRLGRRRY